MFTYFKTKDDLVNALYREIKLDLADAMMSGFPRRTSVRHRLQHVWNGYVDWGVANPLQQTVLKQIQVWSGLTEESKAAGAAPFIEVQRIADETASGLPQSFIGSALSALAETAMEFMRQDPERAETYRTSGFEMLWAGISKKR